MDTKLEHQVVLITGASGGIGSVIARAFAAEGARLVLHYHRRRPAAEALLAELGPDAHMAWRADLRREPDVRSLFRAAVKQFGRVDILVANAGAWEDRDRLLPDISLAQWQGTLDAVLTSAFLCLREFLRLVRRRKRGNAVLIGSTAGIFGEAGHADYAAAKAAMAHGLTRTLKNEIARLAPPQPDYCGGRVNCVCPGWTRIARTAPKLAEPGAIRRVIATMALPKIAKPDDVANAVVFLASDALAGHLTGQTIVVAGGMEGRWLWRPEDLLEIPEFEAGG